MVIQVLNFVRVAVQSRKVNLVSMDRDARDDVLVYELPVDSKLQEFTISVSGERPQVTITDPQGEKLCRITISIDPHTNNCFGKNYSTVI
jgi:hypothetical protein